MARRKSRRDNESIFVVLLEAPWQLSVFLAIVVFGVMRWVIPAQFNSQVLAPLGKMISGVAPLAAICFLIVAALSFFAKKKNADVLDSESSGQKTEPDLIPLKPTSSKVPPNAVRGVSSHKSHPAEWSIGFLRKLEWNRFEKLSAEYFRVLGKRVETVSHGADGGIDARIYAHNSNVLEYAIQCKAWNSMVGVKLIRELFGVMAHESAGKGIFMTTSTFSEDAKQFAAEHNDKLFLIDGQKFISMILKLPEEKKAKLLAFATEGDYTTPTCASCGTKMVWRTKGDFWGCKNYPRCKSTLRVANI